MTCRRCCSTATWQADLVVLASPIYHATMNARMKLFVERTLPMMDPLAEMARGRGHSPPLREDAPGGYPERVRLLGPGHVPGPVPDLAHVPGWRPHRRNLPAFVRILVRARVPAPGPGGPGRPGPGRGRSGAPGAGQPRDHGRPHPAPGPRRTPWCACPGNSGPKAPRDDPGLEGQLGEGGKGKSPYPLTKNPKPPPPIP